MLRHETIPVTPFAQNSGIVFCDRTQDAAVIDPGGDHATLITSIPQRLWPMGDDTVFIPGHGLESTFGHARRTNPYVGGTVAASQAQPQNALIPHTGPDSDRPDRL